MQAFRSICLVVLLIIPAVSALAQPLRDPPQPKPVASDAPRLQKTPRNSNPCAIYGPGFARVEGSSTCVKIGGGVSVGVGASR